MKVLVVPEDPTLDGQILKPILARLFADLGCTATINVLTEPHPQGIEDVLGPDKLAAILERNPVEPLVILVVDRDCDPRHETRAAERVRQFSPRLIACVAIEEMETWMLALHRDELPARWSEVRSECHPKERFAEPFLAQRGWSRQVGRGRKQAMLAITGRWRGLLDACPELEALKARIAEWLSATRAG